MDTENDALTHAFSEQRWGDLVTLTLDWPNRPEHAPWHAWALVAQNRMDEAYEMLQHALRQHPRHPVLHHHMGHVCKRLRLATQAKQHYQAALRLKPNYPEALSSLGTLHYQEGNFSEARWCLEKSLRLDPNQAEAHAKLANTWMQLEGLETALNHYALALRLRPEHHQAAHNYGVGLVNVGRYEEALPWLQQVLAHEPGNAEAWFHQAVAQQAQGQSQEAEYSYRQALQHDLSHARAAHNLATLLLGQGARDEATSWFAHSLKHSPHNPTAQHLLAALQGQNPSAPPPGYVAELFDPYAAHYEAHLKHLKYRIPELLRQAFSPWIHRLPERPLFVDVGCGTGALAPYWSDVVGTFIGIDLSASMLAEAKKKGGYTRLVHGDALVHLKEYRNRAYGVLAADVLGYLGDPSGMFQAMSEALCVGGVLLCSTERMDTGQIDSPGYALQPTGRYQHHDACVRFWMEASGLQVCSHTHAILREQEGVPVSGSLWVAQKTEAPQTLLEEERPPLLT